MRINQGMTLLLYSTLFSIIFYFIGMDNLIWFFYDKNGYWEVGK